MLEFNNLLPTYPQTLIQFWSTAPPQSISIAVCTMTALLATSCIVNLQCFLSLWYRSCNSFHAGNESTECCNRAVAAASGRRWMSFHRASKLQVWFGWYQASVSLAPKYTREGGSQQKMKRQQVPLLVCVQQNTKMLFLHYLLKARSENLKDKVTQSWSLPAKACPDRRLSDVQVKAQKKQEGTQFPTSIMEKLWSTKISAARVLQFLISLQISSTFLPFPIEPLHICSFFTPFFFFHPLNNKDKSQVTLQECQTSYFKIKSYPIQTWTRVFPGTSVDTA